MGLGVCNICGGLHYTSECEHRSKIVESNDPIQEKLKVILELLKTRNALNVALGYYSDGVPQIRIINNDNEILWCNSNKNIGYLLDEAIKKIKELA